MFYRKKTSCLNFRNPSENGDGEKMPSLKSLSEVEAYHIKKILDQTKWNRVETSRILDISRPTLNAKIEKVSSGTRVNSARNKTSNFTLRSVIIRRLEVNHFYRSIYFNNISLGILSLANCTINEFASLNPEKPSIRI